MPNRDIQSCGLIIGVILQRASKPIPNPKEFCPNQACNHMVCINPACGKQYCWVCLQSWEGHGSYFKCNQPKVGDAANNSRLFSEIDLALPLSSFNHTVSSPLRSPIRSSIKCAFPPSFTDCGTLGFYFVTNGLSITQME